MSGPPSQHPPLPHGFAGRSLHTGWTRRPRPVTLVLWLLCCGLPCLPAQETTAPSRETRLQSSPTSEEAGPERLKEQVRIILVTNATESAQSEESSFHWDWSCKGWDGLYLGLSKRSRFGNPLGDFHRLLGTTNALLHLEKAKMTARVGGRVAFDGAGFVTGGDLEGFDGGFEMRRLRIRVKGDCILLLPVSYQLELGYIPHQFDIEESYLAFRDLGYLGTLKIGQYRTPFSLDNYTSTRDIRFMEPAAPVTALSPGVNAGLQFGRGVFEDRMTWTLGFFGSGGATADFGDASQDYGRAIIRLTGLPIVHESPADPSAQRLLHLGLNFNLLYSASSSVRYRTRPESHLAPYVLDTGDIDANSAFMFDVETAWINGPLSLQGEFIGGQVNERQGTDPRFFGCYAQAGWFFTGESRPYLRSQGRFGRIVPRHDFQWRGDGWGAWELVGRFSYTDLNNDIVAGGRMGLITAGVNWHPTAHIHWSFNYITGKVDGPDGEGRLRIFETRLEFDF